MNFRTSDILLACVVTGTSWSAAVHHAVARGVEGGGHPCKMHCATLLLQDRHGREISRCNALQVGDGSILATFVTVHRHIHLDNLQQSQEFMGLEGSQLQLTEAVGCLCRDHAAVCGSSERGSSSSISCSSSLCRWICA